MPPVAAAVAGAAVAGISAGVGAVIAGLSATTAALIGFGSFVLNLAGSLLTNSGRKPDLPTFGGFSVAAQDRTQLVRTAVREQWLAVGELLISGQLTYLEQTNDNKNHHYVVTLLNDESDGFTMYMVNDIPVYPDELDGDGWVTAGRFKDVLRFRPHLGTADQVADSVLIGASAKLDSNFRGRGITYVYIELVYSRSKFPNGVPNFAFLVRGAKLYDPRTATTAWGQNAWLAARYYLTHQRLGLAYETAAIDDVIGNASANICDEFVDTLAAAHTVEAVDAAGDWLELDGEHCKWETGDRVALTTTGTAPAGLTAATNYYVVVDRHMARDDDDDDVFDIRPRVRLAATYANANARTVIDITDAGSGTHTLTKNAEPRYTANGLLDSKRRPEALLRDLYSAAGALVVKAGDKWRYQAAAWVAPTVGFDEDDFTGALEIATEIPERERANGGHGIYVAGINKWQPSDYPIYRDLTQQAADGGRMRLKELDLPMTNRSNTAQRLVKIDVKRLRKRRTIAVPMGLTGMLVGASDTATISKSTRSYVNLPVQVMGFDFETREDDNGNVVVGTRLDFRETASDVYDWDSATEESQVLPAASVVGAQSFNVTAPVVTLESGTDQLLINADGTVTPQIRASWPALADQFVVSDGKIRIGFRENGLDPAPDYQIVQVGGDETEAFLRPVVSGKTYQVLWWAINSLGVESDRSAPVTHLVIGKTALPTTVAALAVQQNGNVVTFQWTAIADADRAGYELRYVARGAAMTRLNSQLITNETKGTLVTNAALPPGSWTIGIWSVDTSGNYAAAPATADIVVVNDNDVIDVEIEHPRWPGTLVGGVRHDVSGRLVPDSNSLASTLSDAQLWDQMVYDPVNQVIYTAAEIDIGFDADDVRVWSALTGGLGPGESGVANWRLQVRWRKAADSYTAWADWTIGTVAARYVQARAILDTAGGVGWLGGMSNTADAQEKTDGGSVTVAAGGTAIAFTKTFHFAPAVTVAAAAVGGAVRHATHESITRTGFTMRVFDGSNVDVGGAGTWTATGA